VLSVVLSRPNAPYAYPARILALLSKTVHNGFKEAISLTDRIQLLTDIMSGRTLVLI
jgi:hypothetical protein